jgi:hypothetical protein
MSSQRDIAADRATCEAATKAHRAKVKALIGGVVDELIQRGLTHDKSKLESPEVDIFAEYTPKLRDTTYGSDEYKGYLKEMQVALEHHYKANRHHPEHFDNGIQGMTLIDLLEMICDWKAATMRHADGDIFRSININMERFGYSAEMAAILRNTVAVLSESPASLDRCEAAEKRVAELETQMQPMVEYIQQHVAAEHGACSLPEWHNPEDAQHIANLEADLAHQKRMVEAAIERAALIGCPTREREESCEFLLKGNSVPATDVCRRCWLGYVDEKAKEAPSDA